MCGIACMVSSIEPKRAEALVERMVGLVQHRGPDGTQTAVVGRCVLGHTRLAIIDLSDRASQPMQHEGHWITYNGEIYNYLELRIELSQRGHEFRTGSDTEVLLMALKEWGIAALERLNGMFAFAYLNEREGKLYIARDRFGVKPLVYHESATSFFVASECKQISAVLDESPRLNLSSAVDYLRNGALNRNNNTFFEGIYQLPGGHYGVYDIENCKLEIHRWYDLVNRIAPRTISYDRAREDVRALLIESIRYRHRADVEIGACLSGGIDSSSIVALCATEFPPAPRTITIFHPQVGFDERKFSRALVDKYSLRCVELQPDSDELLQHQKHEELAYYNDQPLPDATHCNEYVFYKAAREMGIKVILDGQGADEYFGGYAEYWYIAQIEMLQTGRFVAFMKGIEARADALNVKQSAVFARFFRDLFLRRKRAATDPRADWFLFPQQDVLEQSKVESFHELCLRQIEQRSFPYELHCADRNSMRWSVETRLPFLDYRLVEYVLSLPTDYRVGGGFQKRILRDSVPELPNAIARRRDKVGYAFPEAVALSGNATMAREQVFDALAWLGDLVNSEQILKAFDRFCETGMGYDPAFFRVISLGAWSRAFNATV